MLRCKITEISARLQEKVKKAVESMTGLEVAAVNVSVDGVYFEKEPKASKAKAAEKAETEVAEKK